ncbi:MAG TPA: glycosyltransferase [Blastocatellia bacterium]|nr:glycosyltransferase [Blastocatellia bacterium]
MIYVFYSLGFLMIAQGLVSLIEGFRYRTYIRRSMCQPLGTFSPRAALIIPCKGVDGALEENLRAFFSQDYPEYEVTFAIASSDDSARPAIQIVMSENPNITSRLVIAGHCEGRSEKVNNLLCALDYVTSDVRVLVFADSDGRVQPNWMRALVSPLNHAGVGATTGYRWYLPDSGGFWSAVLSAWNGSVATTLGDHRRNFAWGGSTAIMKKTFEQAGIAARWQRAASDDYVLTRAVREAGLRISYVPRCLVVSKQNFSFPSLLEFTTRQIVITRVYDGGRWWRGFISHASFALTFFGGLGLAISGALAAKPMFPTLMLLAVIYLLGSLKGALRLSSSQELLSAERDRAGRLWWMFLLLWPLVSLIFLYNFARSATTRRITWHGVCYELRSLAETVLIKSHGR